VDHHTNKVSEPHRLYFTVQCGCEVHSYKQLLLHIWQTVHPEIYNSMFSDLLNLQLYSSATSVLNQTVYSKELNNLNQESHAHLNNKLCFHISGWTLQGPINHQ
jgi:diphthamide synthase (EF-2-diphthine--ammonia ligase)